MKCTDKERETCNVEKMGCEGCYYNEDNDRDINNLIEELTNVRPNELSTEGLKLFNKINEIIDKNKKKSIEIICYQEESEIKGQVIYSKGQASYIVIASNNDEWELGYLDNLEVIGNIYDNPELLGGE